MDQGSKSDNTRQISTARAGHLAKEMNLSKASLHKRMISVPTMMEGPRPQGRCRFLELPAELRNCIYSYLLSDKRQRPLFEDHAYIYNYQSRGRTIHRKSSKKYDMPFTFITNGFRIEMLLVNKQISHEYGHLVTNHMTLHIRSMYLKDIPDLRGRIGAGRLALASRVVLELTAWCGMPYNDPDGCIEAGGYLPCCIMRELPQYGDVLRHRLAHMPNLREICFNIPYWHAHAAARNPPRLLLHDCEFLRERRHIFRILTAIRRGVKQRVLPQVQSTTVLATQVASHDTMQDHLKVVMRGLVQPDTQCILDRCIRDGVWRAPEWQI